jgi:L-amino acid N-acyltransferase YncA
VSGEGEVAIAQPLASPLTLRPARAGDCAAITEIYRQHVLTGLGSFEEEPPDVMEMSRRYAEVTARLLPYLVVERDGRVAGYAYAAPYRSRSAYRYTLEDSIYVAPWAQRCGAGDLLLARLLALCSQGGYRQMVAVIGDSGNEASIGLHLKHGFRRIGTIEACGYKQDRWVDSVIMQRALGPGAGAPP